MAAIVGVLLSVFFLSGASAECPERNNLFITAPKEMKALSGSCLQIPCNFRPKPEKGFDNRTQITAVWIIKDSRGNNPNDVVFRSDRETQKYPMNVTGNLNQQVCTTLFDNMTKTHTDTYFFRIESKPFRATDFCYPLQIRVEDSPPSPRIELSGELKEAELLVITCSAPAPCPHSPPQLTWNVTENPQNKQEENTDGTFRTKIQESITLSDTHDGYSFTCSVRYPVDGGRTFKTAESKKTLSVSYAPKETSASISPSTLVSAGTRVNMTCSSRAKPPVSSLTWFKESQDGAVNVSVGDFYTFNATDGGVYYCKATNDVGEQKSGRIRLSVSISSLGHPQMVGVQILVKTLEIIILASILVAFECWFRFRFSTKPAKETAGTELK